MTAARHPAGRPTGGQFTSTARSEPATTLTGRETLRDVDRAEARQRRVDQLAATTADEATQLRIARGGDTEQRELLQRNPNLTVGTLAWMVDNWTFNPRVIPEFAAHPQMTDDLRARIRPW